ncbi:GNAT family N-acetyltransferase [Rasiella sp. SM2506]|uniref:GNAT family N-acetyltransferase n=1 Tax=Rasiella sp. SM2506 TaxID=3423914 RepID=UPI003D7A1198
MDIIKTEKLTKNWKSQILTLWNNEYPEKLNFTSLATFETYLKNLTEPSHRLLVDADGNLKGWYFDFIREEEKWFAIIIDSTLHGKGYGTRLLTEAKEKEHELNGWVIDRNEGKKRNGEVYKSPLAFYLKNGFERIPEIRLELEVLSAVKIYWRQL